MFRPSSSLLVRAIACASLIATAIPASAQPASDQDARAAADRALAEGRFTDAREIYAALVAASPNDPHVLREAGRVAHALAQFDAAADLLTRAAAVIHTPDPELHYLLGEALWTLGRNREARAAHELARTELASHVVERMPRLWLARIDSRLGDLAGADRIYDALIATNASDVEAALAQVELHASAHHWARAEQLVRKFLATSPDHRRAQELLAWIEEAQGDAASELALRKQLASDGQRADAVHDYGRALERDGDWAGALAAYRQARNTPGGASDLSLSRALDRLDRRMSPELAAGMTAKSDPGAIALGAFTGVAVPFGRAHHVAISAWNERASKDGRDSYGGELSAAIALRGRSTHAIAGAKLGLIDFSEGTGASAAHHSRPQPGAFGTAGATVLGGHLQLAVDAELGSVWRESPRAVLEGGTVDSATGHVLGVALANRLVIDSGVKLRRLQLEETMGGSPTSKQALAWAGADFALWTNFSSEATGESLDDELLHATYLADSAVLSYRHYELWGDTNPMFDARMTLGDRASIDVASVVARKAVAHGRLAFEARLGGGRDWVRELYLSQAGASLWIAPTSRSRLTLSFDLAKESTGALTGERRTGWMGYHVDL
ncbi:MAG: tetratricopeptide repeat protein [Myxococcales bacterium]|nr:tetratricopeptide repeat protein [Myxococcales bacterium]